MTTLDEDRVKLSADGIVELFQLHLLGGAGVLYLTPNQDITWQTQDYEGTAIQIQGFKKSSDDELTRPKLTVMNNNGSLNPYIAAGVLEGSEVRYYRVLREHIELNVNSFDMSIWRLARVISLNLSAVQCELRRPYDTPRSVAPARMYIPPEFPLVRLG